MYKFLDHPSEALVEVVVKSEEEVFRDAALALFDLMTDLSRVRVEKFFDVQLESPERQLLLIDWLNRLILLHEVERVFLCHFEIELEKTNGYRVKARAGGERIENHHEKRLHAKSATYGQLFWSEENGNHKVRFVIDV
jgi:protein archease